MNGLTAKATLRRTMVECVRAVPPATAVLSAQSAAKSLAEFLGDRLGPGSIVGFHASTPTELSSEPASRLLADRFVLAYPLVMNELITFHRTQWDSLTAHTSRIREPLPSDPLVQPDAIIIPARAFDRFGIRLGHGAGYYDRTIPGLRPGVLLVGYCYSFQVVDELPRDPHDTWVQWLITDDGPPRRCEPLPSFVPLTSTQEGASAHA